MATVSLTGRVRLEDASDGGAEGSIKVHNSNVNKLLTVVMVGGGIAWLIILRGLHSG
eukprot:SAG11_NODE_6026_length_1407_cov_0.714067_2_plen_57_part_00